MEQVRPEHRSTLTPRQGPLQGYGSPAAAFLVIWLFWAPQTNRLFIWEQQSLKNKRGVKRRELKAGLSSAGCRAALMGLGEQLCSQGDNNYGFGFEKSGGLDLHRLSVLPSPPPRILTSKQKGKSPE